MKLPDIFKENTEKSQRKIWSFSVLIIFIVYALMILFKHWPNDIPTHVATIIGIVVTYYFAKSTIKEVKGLYKRGDNSGDQIEQDKEDN